MCKADIELDKTKTEVVIRSGNVELVYMRKEPEAGRMSIARERLPSLHIPMSEWDDIAAVISNWRSVTSWMNASDELAK